MSLIDDFLKSDGALGQDDTVELGLTGEDFDSQLLGGAPSRSDVKSDVKSAAKPSGLDVGSLLAGAFANASRAGEREEEVRSHIKMASHGVRVLGTLYSSIIKNIDPDDSEGITLMMSTALNAVREDAFKITRACGLKDAEVPSWLHSQVSGQVMELITGVINRDNGSFASARKTHYLQPLIDAITNDGGKGISATYYANPDNPELQLTNALMMATADVMTEYQSFTYFNADAKDVARQITSLLKTRVIDETLNDLTHEWNLSGSERAYLGNSMLSHAGKLLASSWAKNIMPTAEYVKSLDVEDRRSILVTGYPLTVVFDDFDNFYGGLEVSAQASLELLRADMGKTQGLGTEQRNSPSPGMRQ